MTIIAVTGPRYLSVSEFQLASTELIEILNEITTLYVGDASGLDTLALRLAQGSVELFRKKPSLPYRVQGAERSTRMVKALARTGGTLHAFPNKPAPQGLQPDQNWPKNTNKSGTWGTIALAVGLGLEVRLHPLKDISIPSWLELERQLSLI